MQEPISIVIADDHPVFRTGLRQIIERATGMDVLGESGDGAAAMRQIRELRPRVAVLDVHMPEMSGLEVVNVVEKERLSVAILILTMFDDEFMFDTAMEHGVLGYILKDSASQNIVQGIQTIAAGRYYISPSLTDSAMRKRSSTNSIPSPQLKVDSLTPTEKRVLHLIADNHKSVAISEYLCISTRTVDRHRENICKKLELSGPYALLRFALEHQAHL